MENKIEKIIAKTLINYIKWSRKMIKDNYNKISKILNKSEKRYYKIYFFSFIIISILETLSVGLIPAYFTIILDTNLLLEQLKKHDQKLQYF